jgi:kinetochore protein Spc7/SPC105
MQLRSILKPTVPLTPPKVIPSFDELRQKSTRKRSPTKTATEELLIDFSTPGPARQTSAEVPITGHEKMVDPFSPIKTSALDTQPDQDEGAAEAKRKADKQAILDRRAERRKSMANRRVSFAPEATLHTWSVMEMAEDSTTSSASNSTRRQSSMTAQATPARDSGRPETPPEQTEEPLVASSPAHQRDLHQRKQRRSSTGPAAQLEGSIDDVFSSSPSGDIHTDSSPVRIDDSVDSDSDDETDGDTAMSMDDPTSQTVGSEDSTASQTSLDDRLRQAASFAGTRGIEYDENGDDLPVQMVEETITHAFQPWTKQNVTSSETQEPERAPDAIEADGEDDDENTQDMSMDVTNAIGGILQNGSAANSKRRKSVANRRRSSVARRRSMEEDSAVMDETMDFTAVGGGIMSNPQDAPEEPISDEELTMEFTNVIGGVLGNQTGTGFAEPVEEDETMDFTSNMDVTTAYGGILPPIEEQTEPQTDVEDQTAAMDVTRAVGGILRPHTAHTNEPTDHMGITMHPDKVNAHSDTGDDVRLQTPHAKHVEGVSHSREGLVTSIASETGSPNGALKPKLSSRSRQSTQGTSTTPKFSPRRPSPAKSSPMKGARSTPIKQVTPRPTRAPTPTKTPEKTWTAASTTTPRQLFKDEIQARKSPASVQQSSAKKNGLFSHDESTGRHTPNVVLKANRPSLGRRRSSGVGIDQQGYGSPKVTEILERRRSIGQAAPSFKLDQGPKPRLRFEDPQQLVKQIDAERAEEERRESGRFIMEKEANFQQEENTTMQLSQMIESMTPKKDKINKLKGRKSLAVGAARGLLGKRPAELDLEDELSPSSPKRLKAVERQSSPVKKVHLPKPPSKEETTGRLTRAEQRRLQEMSSRGSTTPAVSPPKRSATSPHIGARFKELPTDEAANRPESFVDKLDNVIGAVDVSAEHPEDDSQDRISLQDFLNLTNIHFIELSTTKRRHTQAPVPQRPSQENLDKSMEAKFVAAATTLPLLELYQHATRELKSYISTGRKIIRSIEAETLNEQPPLFKEYVDARPDVKAIMDNQFRNGKTNARLQSKEGWYSWRAQLVDGLRSGLEGIKNGMQRDLAQLDQQQNDLLAIVPDLRKAREDLSMELESLQQSLIELENVDRDALFQSRQDLRAADQEHARKSALLQTLKQQMAEKAETLESAEELKAEMNAQIEEADRVRQEYRGWPVPDVLSLRTKVDNLEKQTGWRLLTAEEDEEEPNDFGVALTLAFKNELRLFFYPRSFAATTSQPRPATRSSGSISGPTAPIGLTYSPVDVYGEALQVSELSVENRFFLQFIRSQLHVLSMMPATSVSAKTLLETVSKGWELARTVTEEIRLLSMTGVTTTQILGDERLAIRTKLVLPARSRIDVSFEISVKALADGEISSSTSITSQGVYGQMAKFVDGSKGRKVQTALSKEVQSKELGHGSFVSAIHAFEQWLDSQIGKKAEKEQQQRNEGSKAPATSQSPYKQPATVTEQPEPLPTDSSASLHAIPPVSSKELRRSPLAPKSKNVPNVVSKKLPVPSKRFTLANKQLLPSQQTFPAAAAAAVATAAAAQDQENIITAAAEKQKTRQQDLAQTPTKQLFAEMDMYGGAAEDGLGVGAIPAIAPAEQEQMMTGSPFRRKGALRRSPM